MRTALILDEMDSDDLNDDDAEQVELEDTYSEASPLDSDTRAMFDSYESLKAFDEHRVYLGTE